MFGLTPFHGGKRNEIIPGREFMEMDNWIEQFFAAPFRTGFLAAANPIRADIKETEKEYIIEAEIPGVRKEDIRLELKNDILTIAVEQNEETNEERENYIRKERHYGAYSRSFQVDNVKNETVNARYNDGILTVVLPKEQEKGTRDHRIDIQ